MKARFVALGIVVLSLLPAAHLKAAQHLFDSFESYNLGILDANGTDNAGTNGGANPWWSSSTPSFRVVGAESNVFSFVTPHSGTNMIRGRLLNGVTQQPDSDTEFFNLAFRLNNSNAYSGNILLDYWFYDPIGTNAAVGTNATQFQDYVSLAYFTGLPTNADYNDATQPGLELQAVSLGAGDPTLANTNVYQAQVEGIGDGSYDGQGWFDTTTPRSLGWHHGRISVSPVTNGFISVSFYIDDMINATLTNSTMPGAGFNCIQLTANNGDATAYYDDVRFLYNPNLSTNATLNIVTSGTNAVLTFPDLWLLQTSTNLGNTNGWVTLPNATSPFTNSLGDAIRFFRLKSL